MSLTATKDDTDFTLLAHTAAVRRNKLSLGHIFLFLAEETPNASAAQEAFEEMEWDDKCALYMAPSRGGIWETWERDAIKYGELTRSYDVFQRRA